MRFHQRRLKFTKSGAEIFTSKVRDNGHTSSSTLFFKLPEKRHLGLAKLLALTNEDSDTGFAGIGEGRRDGVLIWGGEEQMRYRLGEELDVWPVQLGLKDRQLHPEGVVQVTQARPGPRFLP